MSRKSGSILRYKDYESSNIKVETSLSYSKNYSNVRNSAKKGGKYKRKSVLLESSVVRFVENKSAKKIENYRTRKRIYKMTDTCPQGTEVKKQDRFPRYISLEEKSKMVATNRKERRPKKSYREIKEVIVEDSLNQYLSVESIVEDKSSSFVL